MGGNITPPYFDNLYQFVPLCLRAAVDQPAGHTNYFGMLWDRYRRFSNNKSNRLFKVLMKRIVAFEEEIFFCGHCVSWFPPFLGEGLTFVDFSYLSIY